MATEIEISLRDSANPNPAFAGRRFSDAEASDDMLIALSAHALLDQVLALRRGALPIRKQPSAEASAEWSAMAGRIFKELHRHKRAGLQPVEIQLSMPDFVLTARNANSSVVSLHAVRGEQRMFGVPIARRPDLSESRVLSILPETPL